MTHSTAKIRIRRRGALLLIVTSLVAAVPVAGFQVAAAHADNGGNSGSGSGSGSDDDGGSDDGGGDDGGSDDGGNDDGGDDHGGGSGGGRGGSNQGGKGAGSQQGSPSVTQRDGALAVRLKGRIAPINEVESIAGKAVPGEIIDVRLYRNKDAYVYKVKIIQQTGSIYDVRIDAVTRKVLSARER